MRTFSAEAEGITNIEELLSGEDSLRDVLINSVAFMLNWKANTIWVDPSAKRARYGDGEKLYPQISKIGSGSLSKRAHQKQ